MKKITLFVVLSVFVLKGFSTTWTVTSDNSSTVFIPADLTINAGDSVSFVLGSFHNAVEVSQATYNANGNTALPGGFSVPFGGGLVLPAQLSGGMHYYVCQNHSAFGMKGTISVLSTSGIAQYGSVENFFNVFPSIVQETINFRYRLEESGYIEIRLNDLLGNVSAVVVSGNRATGDYEQRYTVDRSRIAPGIYFVEMIAGNRRNIQKIIVQ